MSVDQSNRNMYKREPGIRVFVNRNLRLEKIKFFGFDMDYTLAIYKSPDFESMVFDLVIKRMISIGYPDDLLQFEYNPIFPVRGLWFDMVFGNLLKVDGFGNILMGCHGLTFLSPTEIEECYPNKFVQLSDNKIYVLNTLFNLPETYLIACLVDYFDKSTDYTKTTDKTGVKSGDVIMSYKSIFQDVRSAVDYVHFDGGMKKTVLENLSKYVEKDSRVVTLLKQLRENGRKTFLLTNSDYYYTNGIMRYLIGDDWTNHFDISVVDARKPQFFAEGTVFREVNTNTAGLKIGIHAGPLRDGAVYSGGSCDAFRHLLKMKGRDVLYIGDHIFGDVLRSKKTRGWRTFLVVPELNHELSVWTGRRPLFEKLGELDTQMAELYRNLDGNTRDKPEINKLNQILSSIRDVTYDMDHEYGVLGSLFRSGSRTTFFASQVERYADLYASSCYNLVHYPSFYFFRAPMMLMPHESTVDHGAIMHTKPPTLQHQDSVGDQVRGWNKLMMKPQTFCHEEEEEDAPSSNSDTDHDSGRQKKQQEERSDVITNGESRTSTDIVVENPSFVERGD
uniref:Cytosolic purine 5'-nucleotidase n=1 Tax=Panagrolaimus sp. JU765 TaxID=591449 RepID=A0AC34Q5G2_9BILA